MGGGTVDLVIRGVTAVSLGLAVILAHQTACAWFSVESVSCQFGGACLPELVCPTAAILPRLESLSELYSGYTGSLWTVAVTEPSLTCLKRRLTQVPASEAAEPLQKVLELESTGLELSGTSRRLMRSVETDVVWPTREVATVLSAEAATVGALLASLCYTAETDNCTTELNASIRKIQEDVAAKCVNITTAIQSHSTQATDLGFFMQQYGSDVFAFGMDLKVPVSPQKKSSGRDSNPNLQSHRGKCSNT